VKRGIPVFLFACAVGLAQQYVAWTVAGGGQPFTPVAAVNASIGSGGSLATDAGGNVYIRGRGCSRIRDRTCETAYLAGEKSLRTS
jgi:hypothetical protein